MLSLALSKVNDLYLAWLDGLALCGFISGDNISSQLLEVLIQLVLEKFLQFPRSSIRLSVHLHGFISFILSSTLPPPPSRIRQ